MKKQPRVGITGQGSSERTQRIAVELDGDGSGARGQRVFVSRKRCPGHGDLQQQRQDRGQDEDVEGAPGRAIPVLINKCRQ